MHGDEGALIVQAGFLLVFFERRPFIPNILINDLRRGSSSEIQLKSFGFSGNIEERDASGDGGDLGVLGDVDDEARLNLKGFDDTGGVLDGVSGELNFVGINLGSKGNKGKSSSGGRSKEDEGNDTRVIESEIPVSY